MEKILQNRKVGSYNQRERQALINCINISKRLQDFFPVYSSEVHYQIKNQLISKGIACCEWALRHKLTGRKYFEKACKAYNFLEICYTELVKTAEVDDYGKDKRVFRTLVKKFRDALTALEATYCKG